MAKQSGKLKTDTEYFALRGVIGLLGVFPYRISLGIGKWIGLTIAALFPRFKKVAFRNLEIAMPENSTERNREIVKGTFASIGRHIGFISHFRHFDKENVKQLVDVTGVGYVYDALETGRGILFITGHFGSWEVFSLFPAAYDLHINILVRRIDNRRVEEYIDSLRTTFGTVTLGKREAPRRMYRLLSEGKILGILADLNAQLHDGVFVDFFGVPASTTTSIAKIALKTDAIIIPAFAVWEEEKGQYVVHLEPPVEYTKTENQKNDINDITQKFTAVIEKYVRLYPEQWLWIHKRWNTRPKGEQELY